MPEKRVEDTKETACQQVGWKSVLARAVVQVPRTLSEFAWKSALITLGVGSTLTGTLLWRNPGIVFGKPIAEQSMIRRLSAHEDEKKKIFDLMERYYYMNQPAGLMLVAWEELDSLVGIWVRPADKFREKAGEHGLSSDFRVLGGPFLFGECASTESLAMRGKIMVACPINSPYDVWGYVAAVVEEPEVERTLFLVNLLAHRITSMIY